MPNVIGPLITKYLRLSTKPTVVKSNTIYEHPDGLMIGGRDVLTSINGRASPETGAVIRGAVFVEPDVPVVGGVTRRGLRRGSNPGRLVVDFVGNKWTAAGGGAVGGAPSVTTDVTGYDASGVRVGLVSRTGQASMLQVSPTTASDSVRLSFGAVNTPLAGRLGLWVHCANVAGYDTGTGPTAGRIRVALSTNAGGIGNGAQIDWTIEGQLREGWNFLKFVQKGAVYNSPTNLQGGGNLFSGAHPYGIGASLLGSGADSEISSANLRSIMITFVSCAGWVITLDSIWTGFTSTAAVVPGCDQAAQSCVDIALPLFRDYGWGGYVCSPRGVLPNPTTATYADMAANPIYADMVSARATYPQLAALYDASWDVINHTWTHRSMGYIGSASEIKMEIDRARAWAVSSGMPRGSEFYASPGSSTSRLSESVIAGCGIVLQRHSKKVNNSLTPWGFDNPNYLGSYDLGSAANAQNVALMINVLDNCIRYGDVFWPFWHEIRTLGDPGDGSGIYAPDNLNIYASNFRLFFEYVRQRELAGELSVLSPTQLYHGV